LGRFFTEEENEYGKSDVMVLTHAQWRTRFNADPAVIGRAAGCLFHGRNNAVG
jgi:hypothetical protein